jgi:hypothetical protein
MVRLQCKLDKYCDRFILKVPIPRSLALDLWDIVSCHSKLATINSYRIHVFMQHHRVSVTALTGQVAQTFQFVRPDDGATQPSDIKLS